MNRINFVTCVDHDYATTVSVMIRNVLHLHPGCHVWLYDWGLDGAARETFKASQDTTTVAWAKTAGPRFRVLKRLHRYYWPVYFYLRERNCVPDFLARVLCFEQIFIEKIRCLRHLSGTVGSEPIVYLDGDAIPIKQLDALVDPRFDLSCTIRR